MKQLWMLTGGNGVGKSTFYEQILQPLSIPFINADLIAKQVFPDDPVGNSYQAARIAEQMRYDLLEAGQSFCFETVFSHPSKVDFLAMAKAQGYQIILVFIHIDDVSLNLARIQQRVIDGGHSVPNEKVIARIPRLLVHIKQAIPLCDRVEVLDNSRLDHPFKRLMSIQNGQCQIHQDSLPDWATRFKPE